jgi:hypothetical protein
MVFLASSDYLTGANYFAPVRHWRAGHFSSLLTLDYLKRIISAKPRISELAKGIGF